MSGQGSGTNELGQKKSFQEQFDWQLDHDVSPPRFVAGVAGKRSGAYWAISSTLAGSSELLNVAIVDSSGNQISTFGGGTTFDDGDALDTDSQGTLIMGATAIAGTARAIRVNNGGQLDIRPLTSSDVVAAAQSGTWVLGANSGVDIGDVTINNAAGASAVNVQDGGNSLTVDGTLAVTQSGTWNITNISGTISLPTGASTLAEQQTQTTALQLIDDTVATLGTTTYTEATTKGLTIGAVRRDADTTLVNTTNEIGPLQMDANGRLKVEVFSGETLPVSLTSTTITGTVAISTIAGAITPGTAATSLGKAEDAGHATGDTGVMALGVANTADANISGTTLDYTPFATDLTGAVHIMGKVAHDAPAPANPLLAGYRGQNTVPTAVSAAGDLVNAWALLTGAQVVSNPIGTPGTESEDCASASTTYRHQTTTTIVHNCWIEAPEQNNGVITFGGSSTYANNFARLRAGERRYIGTIDLSLLYFGSTSAGDDCIVYYTS